MENKYCNIVREEQDFEDALEQDRSNRESSERNWRMYSGFEYGQWDKDAIAKLTQMNRHIAQYNFIRGKIDGLAGSIVKNSYDVDFVAVEGDDDNSSKVFKSLMYSDKELLDWENEYNQVVVDGLVHSGVEQMIISDRYNPIGNIGFERIMPNHIILDPLWKSHNSWNLKRAWKISYKTAYELKLLFPESAKRIDDKIYMLAMTGLDYEEDSTSAAIPYFKLDETYGSLYRVIEKHYIKEVAKTTTYVIGDDNEEVEVPDGTKEEQEDFITRHSILREQNTIKRRIVDKEYWVKTFCTQLNIDMPLQDKKSEIQIGRLPFFPFSSGRINGVNSGVVDLLIDIQQSINKRESLSEHMISTGAHGAKLVDPSLFNNDRAMIDAFISNSNKPDAVFETAPGALRMGGRDLIVEVPKTSYSGEIYKELERMGNYMDIISKQTATLEGRNESAHDTGVLFARRQLQSEISQAVLSKHLVQHWNDKGEAYLLLAKQLYSNVYREFKVRGENGKFQKLAINIPKYSDSGVEVENDIGNMPRHKVVVSQSPNGISVRATERAINTELMQYVPQENYLSRAQLTKNMMKTLPMNEEDKARLEFASELEYQFAAERMKNDILTMKANQVMVQQQIAQADQQQQMNQQQMQQGIPQGEEVPLEKVQ